jgi:hypothetical protein
MSPVTLERTTPERETSEFYADVPALEAYHAHLTKEKDLKHEWIRRYPHSPAIIHGWHPRTHYENPVIAYLSRGHDVRAQTHLARFDFESCDTTGNDFHRLTALVSELAARPRSYSRDLIEDVPAKHSSAEQNQVIAALLALEFSEVEEEDQFPHTAFRSFSQEEGAEIERILDAGAPDWVRELRQKLGR